MRREKGTGRSPDEWDDGRAPRREVDEEKTGQRAGTPPNLIRRPVRLPAMAPIKDAEAA